MKHLFFAFAIVACVSISVKADTAEEKAGISPERKAEVMRRFAIHSGGPKIPRPGTPQGKISIVNAQVLADRAWISSAVDYIQKDSGFNIELSDGKFDFPNPQIRGSATLFIIDNQAMPRLLIAPENRWAMINVSPLQTDKAVFFEARVKKEISRAFAMLCGGMSSGYSVSLVGAITKPEDLDIFPDGKLPVDVLSRFEPYMSKFGARPAKLVPYKVACQEGWAPAPTNDVERTIWNHVHAIPDKPITIEFDPKKDK